MSSAPWLSYCTLASGGINGTLYLADRGDAVTSILDAVRQQLGPDAIQQMSGALGAEPAVTSNAVSLALPAILAGLSQNASQPQGAAALDTALNAHDGSILDN